MDRTHSHIDLDERTQDRRAGVAGLGMEIIAEKLGRYFRLSLALHCYGNLNGARFRGVTRGVMHRKKRLRSVSSHDGMAHGFALDADPQYTLLVELLPGSAAPSRHGSAGAVTWTVLREQESARTFRSARGVNPQLMECNGFANGSERSQATDTRPSPNLPSSLPE